MGDIANAMLDGTFCQQCGEYIDGTAPGYPRTCGGCGGQWGFHVTPGEGKHNKRRKRKAREAASKAFDEVAKLAESHDMKLRECSDAHYQLSHINDGWLLNLYPSNCRVYADPNKPKAPYLDLAGVKWSLQDVVEAAIQKASET